MLPSIEEYEASRPARLFYIENFVQGAVERGKESKFQMTLTSVGDMPSLSGMNRVPVTASSLIGDSFRALDIVKAVLVGEGDNVHHVWVLISEWTPEARKRVYAIQKQVMQSLRGFNFDFYVMDIEDGVNPDEMVSGMPIVFDRTQAQERAN